MINYVLFLPNIIFILKWLVYFFYFFFFAVAVVTGENMVPKPSNEVAQH